MRGRLAHQGIAKVVVRCVTQRGHQLKGGHSCGHPQTKAPLHRPHPEDRLVAGGRGGGELGQEATSIRLGNIEEAGDFAEAAGCSVVGGGGKVGSLIS